MKRYLFYFILKNEAIKIIQNLKGNKKCEHMISILFKLLGLQSFIYIYNFMEPIKKSPIFFEQTT